MASSSRRRPRPPELPRHTDLLQFFLKLKPEQRREALARLGPEDVEAIERDWPTWAHPGQVPEAGDWSTCVVKGGRSFGKTRAGSEWIVTLLKGPDGLSPRNPLRFALVGATLAEARSVMVEGKSGLMEVAGPWIREWQRGRGLLLFRTGAQAQLFSGHSPEMLRGPEHDYAWCDELAKWEKPGETWDMLQLGLRLGTRPRALVTTTPRPGPHLRRIMAEPGTLVIGGPSDANPHNSPAWMGSMRTRYAGTRLERQELNGELLTDAPGALWTVELLERCRHLPLPRAGGDRVEGLSPSARSDDTSPPPAPPASGRGGFTRIVIAVDPPSGAGTCGIIACAKDREGRAHVLADHSVTGLSPEGWARAVANAARIHANAPLPLGEREGPAAKRWEGEGTLPVQIVAEQNQGGKMVESVLRTADPGLRVKLVTATVGKAERAAPVAMLFEAGKVALHGRFPELESELLGMIAGGAYEGPGASPDRADAMVWGLTELMLQPERAEPRIWSL